MTESLLNLHGQKMGRKGRLTRQRIIEVALDILQNSSYKDLTVAELAHAANISSSTFYVYFEDIEDVLFSCVQTATTDMASLISILDEDWNAANLSGQVRKFVEGYHNVWEKHRVQLRIRNLEADQGNVRFQNYRVQSTQQLLDKLGEKIAQLNPTIEDPSTTAMVFYAGMERLAAANYPNALSTNELVRDRFNNALAELLYILLKQG